MNGITLRRIFFALPIDDIASTGLGPVLDLLSAEPRTLKPVPRTNFHITVKFIGEIDDSRLEQMSNFFDNIKFATGPIEYNLRRLGAFPSINRPNVLWCGIQANPQKLADIHAPIENLCTDSGFKKDERAFSPHLTLARIKKEARVPQSIIEFLKKNSETEFGQSSFKEVILYESILKPAGPAYIPIKSIKL